MKTGQIHSVQIKRGLRHALVAAMLGTTLLSPVIPASTAFAQQQGTEHEGQLPLDDRLLAEKLIRQLYHNLAADRAETGSKRRLAIAPVDPGNTGISPAFARQLEASLTDALVTQNPGTYRINSRADLDALVSEIGTFNSNEGESETRRLTRLFREAGGDYLLALQFTQGQQGSLRLYLRAVSVKNGHIPAVASIDNIAWQPEATDVATLLRSPESAAHAAARDFVSGLPDLDRVALSALYYGNSGFQGEFGTWWQSVLKAALSDQWQLQHRGQRKELGFRRYHPKDFLPRPSQQHPVASQGNDSISWNQPQQKDTTALDFTQPEKDSLYHLSGSYWDLGTEVEIQLEMRNRSGHFKAWRGRISRQDIVVALEPDNPSLTQPRQNDGLGPVNLRMTSNHGTNPVLQIGDRLSMQVTVDRPSWLSCYYQQADSTVMRIYPTRYDSDNRITSTDIVSIPDSRAGYAFQVTAPTGSELVKCFATDRNVSHQLPGWLQVSDFTPLSARHINDVVRAWRRLRNTHLSEASTAITVLD